MTFKMHKTPKVLPQYIIIRQPDKWIQLDYNITIYNLTINISIKL